MLTLDQFDYHLPDELIAQKPAEPRDHSRLLVLDRLTGNIDHRHFYDLADVLPENSLVVRNNTKVLPARLLGNKSTGGAVEILLTKRVELTAQSETWEVLTKPGLKIGQKVLFPDSQLVGECVKVTGYTRLVTFNFGGQAFFDQVFQIGHTPIPPYIQWNDDDEQTLREKYQTLYAKIEGSAAAPTAGLHFTSDLDQKLQDKGIEIVEVTLHVGLGTFLPVKEAGIEKHHMHSEWYEIKPEVAEKLNQAKKNGQKIIAVGTTTTRVLETCAVGSDGSESEGSDISDPSVVSGTGDTDIYIYPPYQFKFVDGLITNFHLPKSTLLMMISAFVSVPNTDQPFSTFADSMIGKAYQEAIEKKYRFYSFGDGMVIL